MKESTPNSAPEGAAARNETPGGIAGFLRNRFVKDTAWLQAGTLVTTGTYVLTSMILARGLGPSDLGRYDLAYKFYDFCYFVANLGLINATVVRYSHAVGRRSEEDKLLALAAFLKIYLLMAAAIVVLGAFLCPWAGTRIYGDRLVGTYGWILCIMGIIDLGRAVTVSTLLGARHMEDVARYESAIAIARLAVLVLAVAGGFGLTGVVFGTVAANAAATLMGARFFFLLRRSEGPERPPSLAVVLRAVPRAKMKDFFTLGFFIAINKNLMILVNTFGTLFMASVSFWDTGHLRIAVILMWGLALLLGGVSRNLLPTLGFQLGDAGRKDLAGMGRYLLKVSLITGFLFIAVTGLFLLALPFIVRIVYGTDYLACIGLVLILASAHLVLGFAVIAEPFYIYANRIKTAVVINGVIFCILVPFGYWMREFGAVGVASWLAISRCCAAVHLAYIALYFFLARRRAAAAEAKGEAGP